MKQFFDKIKSFHPNPNIHSGFVGIKGYHITQKKKSKKYLFDKKCSIGLILLTCSKHFCTKNLSLAVAEIDACKFLLKFAFYVKRNLNSEIKLNKSKYQ